MGPGNSRQIPRCVGVRTRDIPSAKMIMRQWVKFFHCGNDELAERRAIQMPYLRPNSATIDAF
eukprot:767429-Hanusia_phi.AAC.6